MECVEARAQGSWRSTVTIKRTQPLSTSKTDPAWRMVVVELAPGANSTFGGPVRNGPPAACGAICPTTASLHSSSDSRFRGLHPVGLYDRRAGEIV